VSDQIIRWNQLPNAINYAVSRHNGTFWNTLEGVLKDVKYEKSSNCLKSAACV